VQGTKKYSAARDSSDGDPAKFGLEIQRDLLTQAYRDASALEASLGAAIDHIELLAIDPSGRSTG
jgi:hypothetical protein